jgi:hypothetical protein
MRSLHIVRKTPQQDRINDPGDGLGINGDAPGGELMAGEGLVLRAARGESPVGSCEADGGPVSIGRWSGATLQLDDEAILPVQVVLDPEDDGRWRLVALAPEGCLVNGQLKRRAWVRRGDRIAIGPYEISVAQVSSAKSTSSTTATPIAGDFVAARVGKEVPLRASLRWRGTVIDTRVVAPGEVLTLGQGKQVVFELPSSEHQKWGAAACLEGVWHVALDTPLRVVDITGAERPLLSAAPRTDGPALPRGFATGKLWAPVLEGARVRLDAGDLTIELERSDFFAAERVPRPARWATREGQQSIIAAMVFVFVVAMFWVTPKMFFDPDDIGAGIAARSVLAQFMPPSAKPLDATPPDKHKEDKLAEEAAAKHSGEEGQSGKQNVPSRDTRSSRSNEQVVADNALLRLLNQGSTSRVLGGGALGQIDAVGHLDGATAGDAQGMMGLGVKGIGLGGGGQDNDSVGIGPVGSHGPGVGAASTVGKIKHGGNGSDLSIDEPANVVGGLDREVIRRVIVSHRAQIRYCYEKELSVKPGLAGKVLVQFVIAADGSVTMARPSEQTLDDPEVGKCIVSKVKTWTFPQPKGGGVVEVTYPFLFKPAGQGAH